MNANRTIPAEFTERLAKQGWAAVEFSTNGPGYRNNSALCLYPVHWPRPINRNSLAVRATWTISYASHRDPMSPRNKRGRAWAAAMAWAKSHRPSRQSWDEVLARVAADRAAAARSNRAEARALLEWGRSHHTAALQKKLADSEDRVRALENRLCASENDHRDALSQSESQRTGMETRLTEVASKLTTSEGAIIRLQAEVMTLTADVARRTFQPPVHRTENGRWVIGDGEICTGSVVEFINANAGVSTGRVTKRLLAAGFDWPFRENLYEIDGARVAASNILRMIRGAVGVAAQEIAQSA
jgi:hypothetical protein